MPSPPAGPLAPSSASPSAEAGVVGDIVGSGTKDGEGCADEAGVVIKANAKQSVSTFHRLNYCTLAGRWRGVV